MQGLFRKEALDSFSSSSEINRGVRAVSIKTSVFVVLLIICAAVFAVWLVFGTVYETVSVNGIIRPAGNNGSVYANSEGFITKIIVDEGDKVKTGDILALIPQEDILMKIKEGKINSIQTEELNSLYNEYDRLSVIRSNIDGIVTDIISENVFIRKGEKIASIIPYSEGSNNKTLTAFIPADKSGIVSLGMEVQVMPEFAPREKYGYIKAYVSDISSSPITNQSINDMYNELFFSESDEKETYFQLEITLMPDANSASHLKWSNPNSEKTDVDMGTLCDADIIIKKCRPCEWLF